MSLFNYPKGRHVRRQRPRQFKRYETYKRFLQHEFARVCVYCRQPDTSAPNLSFGVDHYRPKSIPRFAHLARDYTNLYYCCGICNSRKNADWPLDEVRGPYVVNPCDHDMTQHLRFVVATGEVDARSFHGEHTKELLQLNDPGRVQYRCNALLTLRMCDEQLASADRQLAALKRRLREGAIGQADHDQAVTEIELEKPRYIQLKQSVSGETPLPPIRPWRLGANLVR